MTAHKTHIHLYRDNDQKTIFLDRQDYQKFISFLKGYLANSKELANSKTTFTIRGRTYKGTPRGTQNFFDQIELLAFKLEPHRFDLLIIENTPEASKKFIRALSTRYALYFNRKHKHRGALFNSPYNSEQIDDPDAVQSLIRNFHSRAGAYSSNPEYLGQRESSWVKPQSVPATKKSHSPLAKTNYRAPEIILASVVLAIFSYNSVNKIQASNISPLPVPVPINTPTPNVLGEEDEAVAQVVIKINDNSPFVNLRQEPSVNSPKIGKAYAGERFEFVSETSGWYNIKLDNGTSVYVSTQYSEIENQNTQ